MQNSTPQFQAENLRLAAMPRSALDVVLDITAPEQPVMAAYQAQAVPLGAASNEISLMTSRGEVRGVLTGRQGEPGAVLWLNGAAPGMNGPAGGVFAYLTHTLRFVGITSLRMDHRNCQSFDECLLDALMGLSLLKAGGIREVVVVGYQRGAAVALAAAALVPWVKAAVSLAGHPDGAAWAGRIAPRPLLLIHGEKDTQITPDASQTMYEQAQEPKELVIYPDAGFRLLEVRDALAAKLGGWLADQLGRGDAYRERTAAGTADRGDLVRALPGPAGAPERRIILTRRSLMIVDAEALVSPTGTWLDLKNTPLARDLVRQGGEEIQAELYELAPLFMGEVGVTGAGRLPARYVFHAITGGISEGEELSSEQMVASTTDNALHAAAARGVRSIAFPALAAGNRGVPAEKVAQIMLAAIW
ncbi:MAG: macro domain-containing protein [Chloroflexi bacterium]|nr:macro domain-containing protein [Chloroflexota bacterium]